MSPQKNGPAPNDRSQISRASSKSSGRVTYAICLILLTFIWTALSGSEGNIRSRGPGAQWLPPGDRTQADRPYGSYRYGIRSSGATARTADVALGFGGR